MVETASTMLPLGTQAPDFELLDTVTNEPLALSNLKSDQATVIMFICNHCPYVVHISDKLVELAKEYQQKGVNFIAISSNDVVTHPADSPNKMSTHAKDNGFTFPYLYDETQEVAKAYKAACTPDFYIFDGELKCAYRGRFDGATPKNNVPVTGDELRQALDNILTGKPVSDDQKPSLGCNIKWK
ncbi:MAG: thioredoxin family protein [Gammaproteobacteria bacterium]